MALFEDIRYPEKLDMFMSMLPTTLTDCLQDLAHYKIMMLQLEKICDNVGYEKCMKIIMHLRYRHIILSDSYDIESTNYRIWYECKLPLMKWSKPGGEVERSINREDQCVVSEDDDPVQQVTVQEEFVEEEFEATIPQVEEEVEVDVVPQVEVEAVYVARDPPCLHVDHSLNLQKKKARRSRRVRQTTKKPSSGNDWSSDDQAISIRTTYSDIRRLRQRYDRHVTGPGDPSSFVELYEENQRNHVNAFMMSTSQHYLRSAPRRSLLLLHYDMTETKVYAGADYVCCNFGWYDRRPPNLEYLSARSYVENWVVRAQLLQ